MTKSNKKLFIFFTIICLQACIITSPDWLKINGINPCWPVILLLPFSIKNRPGKAIIASILLGIFIDSFTVSDISYIPSLLILSLLWSKYG